jgi:RimM protein, required for 16S rRNA processing
MQDFIEIGQIVNTHGLKGELKVIPLTDNPNRFLKLKEIFVDIKGVIEEFKIENAKLHKNTVLLKLTGIDDINDCGRFKRLLYQD